MIKKVSQPVAEQAPIDLAPAIADDMNVSVRDEFAMRLAAAIVTGIVQRGGVNAIAAAFIDDDLMRMAYGYADSAMRARVAS